MPNPETQLSLDEAVGEVFGLLTGLDLQYDPMQDRYKAVVRQINRALRSVALEKEWSYFASTESVGLVVPGERSIQMRSSVRPRMINDDAVRLVDSSGRSVKWAYFLPRDAINKYTGRQGLWCSVVRQELQFSRAFDPSEAGLDIQVPVQREPRMFRLPKPPEIPGDPWPEVPMETREQLVDFAYPDIVVLKAAYFYAQSDPVMQPRVQTLDAQYKDLYYQVVERDDRMTDSPFMNDFSVPVQGDLFSTGGGGWSNTHPHSDERF